MNSLQPEPNASSRHRHQGEDDQRTMRPESRATGRLRPVADRRGHMSFLRALAWDTTPQTRPTHAATSILLAAAIASIAPGVLHGAEPAPPAGSVAVSAEPKVSADEAILLRKAQTLAQSEPQAAIALIEATLYPDTNPALLFSLGCLCAQNGQLARAENLFALALERAPGFVRARHNLATVLAQQEKLEDSSRELQALLRQQPDRQKARQDLATVFVRQRKFAEAERELQALIDAGYQTQQARMTVADVMLQQERLEDARRLLHAVVTDKPDDERARKALAHVLLQLGDRKAAAQQLAALLARNPDLTQVRVELANVLVRLEQYDDAVEHLREVLQRDAQNQDARMLLAGLLAQAGLHDAACEQLRVMLEHEPAHLEAREAIAASLLNTGKKSQAIDELSKLMQLDPERHAARLQLAHLLLQQEQFEQAAHELGCLLERGAPDKGNVLRLLGQCLRDAGQPLAAESAFRNALQYGPDAENARLGLIGCLLDQAAWASARSLLRVELGRNPLQADLWKLLVDADLEQGREPDALVALECARRLGLADREARMALADLCIQQGFYEHAVQHYTDTLADDASPPLARILNAVDDLAKAGRIDDAETLLTSIAAIRSDLSSDQKQGLLALEARISTAAGNHEKALQLYEQILAQDPLDADALMGSGDLLRSAGKLTEAQARFECLARISVQHRSLALVRQAQIAVQHDEYRRATDLLESSLKLRYQPHVERYLEQVRRMIQ